MKRINCPFTKQGIETAIKKVYGDEITVNMNELELIKEHDSKGYASSVYRFSNKYYKYDIMIETEDFDNIPIRIRYIKKKNNC